MAGLRSSGTAASLAERRRKRDEQGLLGGSGDNVSDRGDSSGINLAIEKIAKHPKNRKDLGTEESLQEFADSVRAVNERTGLPFLQLPVVTTREAHLREWPEHGSKIPSNATHVMVFGHRRMEAARRAGFEEIPVFVRDEVAGVDLESMIMENLHRQGLNPIDEAVQLGDLKARGYSEREIARRTGISQSQVNKRLKLLSLPQLMQDAVAEGRLPVIDALNVAALKDSDHIRQVWTAVEAGAAPKEALRAHHARIRSAQAKEEAERQGLPLIDPGNVWGPAATLRIIEGDEAIEDARRGGTLAAAISEDGTLTYLSTANEKSEPGRQAKKSSKPEGSGRPERERSTPSTSSDSSSIHIDTEADERASACSQLVASGELPLNILATAVDLLVHQANTAEALELARVWLANAGVAMEDGDSDRVVLAISLAARELAVRATWPNLGPSGAAHLEALATVGYHPAEQTCESQ